MSRCKGVCVVKGVHGNPRNNSYKTSRVVTSARTSRKKTSKWNTTERSYFVLVQCKFIYLIMPPPTQHVAKQYLDNYLFIKKSVKVHLTFSNKVWKQKLFNKLHFPNVKFFRNCLLKNHKERVHAHIKLKIQRPFGERRIPGALTKIELNFIFRAFRVI